MTVNLIKFSSLFVSIFTFKYLCVKVVRGRDVRAIVIWEYFYFLVTFTPLVGDTMSLKGYQVSTIWSTGLNSLYTFSPLVPAGSVMWT